MSESEALALAFVSGFCTSDGRGMLGSPHGPWTNLPLCGFGVNLLLLVNLWDGRTPFRFVTSGVPPKEEFQSRALGKSEGTTQTMFKNWDLGAWQAQYAVSSSNHCPWLKMMQISEHLPHGKRPCDWHVVQSQCS